MDLFAPGIRELGRKLCRLTASLELWWRGRQLAKAQTSLGFLGWQQADFDPQTQRQVEEITNVEKEQARLINEAAEKGIEIRKARSALEARHRANQERRRAVAEEERKLREPRVEMARRLEERRKIEPNFERRIPELDQELREVTKLIAELLRRETQTPKTRQELTLLRERSVAIPNEKSDLRNLHFRTVNEIRAMEEELQGGGEELTEQQQRLADLDAQAGAEEAELAEQIREIEREKGAVEKRAAEMEAAKTNPYQQIGEVLSLANVAPMNQPQALLTVKELEFKVGEVAQRVAESRAASAAQNPRELRRSYWLLGGTAVGAGVVLYAAVM